MRALVKRTTWGATPGHGTRTGGGFTIIELLMASAITLILGGIASDLFVRIQTLVAVGAANYEVVTTAAVAEQVLRNDFQRLSPKGFIAIRWGDSGSSIEVTPAQFGAPVVNSVTGVGLPPLGAILSVPIISAGAAYSSTFPSTVFFFDPAGTGSGAAATVTLNASGGVASVNVLAGGANYSANTQVFLDCFPVDQIAFMATGPWTTTRYNIQSNTAAAGGTTDSGLDRTFQTDTARIWYGHLFASTNLPSYYGGVSTYPFAFNYDESFTSATPAGTPMVDSEYWRLGRHVLLISSDPNVRYDGIGVDSSGGGSGGTLLPIISGGSITALQLTNVGGSYPASPILLIPPPTNPPTGTPASGTAGTTGGILGGSVGTPIISGSSGYTFTGGTGYDYLFASQSLWQTTNYYTANIAYYGIQNGLSDIVMSSDLSNIRSAITTPTSTAPLNSLNQAIWSPPAPALPESPGQRMLDSCFRVYGTPYLQSASNITAESVMPTQSVLGANCSGFKVEVSVDGTFTDVPRPTGAVIQLTVNAGGVVTGANVISGGVNYNPSYTIITAPGPGSGATFTISVNAQGQIQTPVTVNAGGTGYTPGMPLATITPYYCAGYGLGGAATGCQAWPRLIRITTTLQDQHATIHQLHVTDPVLPDGRQFTYVLEVPQ